MDIKDAIDMMQGRAYQVLPFGYMFRATVTVITLAGSENHSIGIFATMEEAQKACMRDLEAAKLALLARQAASATPREGTN